MPMKKDALGAIAKILLQYDDEQLLGILEELKSNVRNSSGLVSEVLINLNCALISEMRVQIKAEKKKITKNLSEEEVSNLQNTSKQNIEAMGPKAARLRTLNARQQTLAHVI